MNLNEKPTAHIIRNPPTLGTCIATECYATEDLVGWRDYFVLDEHARPVGLLCPDHSAASEDEVLAWMDPPQ